MTALRTELEFNYETKHSVRYDAATEEADLKSIYISKRGLPKPWPRRISVLIEEVK